MHRCEPFLYNTFHIHYVFGILFTESLSKWKNFDFVERTYKLFINVMLWRLVPEALLWSAEGFEHGWFTMIVKVWILFLQLDFVYKKCCTLAWRLSVYHNLNCNTSNGHKFLERYMDTALENLPVDLGGVILSSGNKSSSGILKAVRTLWYSYLSFGGLDSCLFNVGRRSDAHWGASIRSMLAFYYFFVWTFVLHVPKWCTHLMSRTDWLWPVWIYSVGGKCYIVLSCCASISFCTLQKDDGPSQWDPRNVRWY